MKGKRGMKYRDVKIRKQVMKEFFLKFEKRERGEKVLEKARGQVTKKVGKKMKFRKESGKKLRD